MNRVIAALSVVALLVAGAVGAWLSPAATADEHEQSNEFGRNVVDFGVVVTDIDRSLAFYTEGIGLKETGGFGVPTDVAEPAGLTDGKPLDIHVLQTREDENATRIKLMEVEGVTPTKLANDHIHTTTGISYMTLFPKNITPILERLKERGVEPIADGPVAIPGGDAYLAVVRDPDGNFVELVGPME